MLRLFTADLGHSFKFPLTVASDPDRAEKRKWYVIALRHRTWAQARAHLK